MLEPDKPLAWDTTGVTKSQEERQGFQDPHLQGQTHMQGRQLSLGKRLLPAGVTASPP